MENIVYYFTGTGTSIGILRKLEKEGLCIHAIPILSTTLPCVVPETTKSVGIIYPVYMNALPFLVQKFICHLKVKGHPFIYIIATHGGVPGAAGANLVQNLNKSELKVNAYYEIEGINNTPKGVAPKPLMQLNWETILTAENYEAMENRFSNIIPEIVSDITHQNDNVSETLYPKSKGLTALFMKLMWRLSKSKPKLDLLIDNQSCDQCGICEKICLTSRIKLSDDGPKFISDDCHYCYACFNYCPKQAIYVKHYAKKKGRYHYPKVNWQDIANQKMKNKDNTI